VVGGGLWWLVGWLVSRLQIVRVCREDVFPGWENRIGV